MIRIGSFGCDDVRIVFQGIFEKIDSVHQWDAQLSRPGGSDGIIGNFKTGHRQKGTDDEKKRKSK